MKDIRISIRLTEEEHECIKIIAIHKKKKIQQLIHEYIQTLLKENINESN